VVVTFSCSVLPEAPVAEKPPTTSAPCPTAYVLRSAPRRGVCIKTPPRNDLALPIDDTVMSSREPSRTKAGMVAVTTTAATLRKRACLASTWMPRRRINARKDCCAKGTVMSSPVPFKPVTTP